MKPRKKPNTVVLLASQGQIVVEFDAKKVFVGSPQRVALFLRAHEIATWLYSSSMDFGKEYGFAQNDVRTQIEAEYRRLSAGPISDRIESFARMMETQRSEIEGQISAYRDKLRTLVEDGQAVLDSIAEAEEHLADARSHMAEALDRMDRAGDSLSQQI